MELNFSSDIDLMFAYSEDGKTDGGADGQSVSNQEFFARLSERIVKTATETTAEGFLYRIDMRLRPDGAAGALTMPLSGYEGYYMRRGELWERQMLIKARPCAGSAELGNRFLQMIQPFVYPRHFEASPTVEIHRIKQRIEAQIGRKGQGDTHLKLRSGGIRDIEFTVQCLQLLVGRIHQSARSDNTLEAIRQLRRVAALSPEEADALREAYVFFRRLEHRMQMMHNRSDYILPDDDLALRVIARTMGYDEADACRTDLQQHLMGVQTVYANVFSEIPESEGRSVGALVEKPPGESEALRLLSEIGFARPEEAHRNLIYMAFGHVPRIKGTQSRKSFTELAPALMHALQNSADPDQGLGNLERLVSAYGAGDMLFRMLTTNRGFRDLLLSLCVGSQYLVQVIVRNPGLLDWLIRPEVLHQNPGAEDLRMQLREQVAQSDDGVGVLNRLKNRELLRIGTRDLLDLTNTFETFEALTILADAVVQTVYEMVSEKLTAQHGIPRNEQGDPAAFAVVGLGKMGGQELNFGSDLDLVFVYSQEGETDGNRSNLQYFIELAQQMTTILERNTPYGKLYPVDARLRPEGGNALLALSFDAYDQYLIRRASTWERLALSRSRVVAGDPAFGRKLLARFEGFVIGNGFSEDETAAMCNIRHRMEKKGDPRTQVQPSIKTDPGGIVDIEFIAQILQLKHAVHKPDLRSANTLESLDKLVASGHLAEEDAAHLKRAFAFLRTVEKIMRRQNEQARTRLPADKRALTALARAVDSDTPEAFVEVLASDMAKTRALFERLIGNV
jgi:[glutamine synthetase] adenylyltransferase / [glutamine synthetase]-adenylyl-L-tyrosine phosphorylase